MRLAIVLVLLLVTAGVGAAAEPVNQSVAAPVDRVWAVTEAVLKHLGWEIEKADRAIGWITTKSRRMEGEDFGVYEKGKRHRLRVHVKAEGELRSTVTVERELFARERILWIDKDEPIPTSDQTVEKSILAAIDKAL
jgi:hypothetical protein